MFEYFVSYSHKTGFGNCTACVSKEIKSVEDIRMLKDAIMASADPKGFKPKDVIILYYNRLS